MACCLRDAGTGPSYENQKYLQGKHVPGQVGKWALRTTALEPWVGRTLGIELSVLLALPSANIVYFQIQKMLSRVHAQWKAEVYSLCDI